MNEDVIAIIDTKIAQLTAARAVLAGKAAAPAQPTTVGTPTSAKKVRRKVSKAARKAISEGIKNYWAEKRKQKGTTPSPAKTPGRLGRPPGKATLARRAKEARVAGKSGNKAVT